MRSSIGIDFGTTNSVLSFCSPDGSIQTVSFPWSTGDSQTFRSIICFWQEGHTLHHACGQTGIDEYLKDTEESRLIQSIKTYLGSEIFKETRVFGTRFDLEDLIALFIKDLWQKATKILNIAPDPNLYSVVSGRPVKFAGSNPNESLAVSRLLDSYRRAGFHHVTFAYEPEGAAFWFARRENTSRHRILIADFGGGTSDFSIVDVQDKNVYPIAHSGIGIAGDILDFRLIDHLIAPLLGKGSHYDSFGKSLPMPTSYYHNFASWHLLSLIKTPKTIREIQEISRTTDDPDGVFRLLSMIENEMGYLLYGAVAATKSELSKNDSAVFKFHANSFELTASVNRYDFEEWISSDVAMIRQTIESLLEENKIDAQTIDRIFMTGGTSFVPAIQNMMIDLFGNEKMARGNEFTSVSAGLALIAHERMNHKEELVKNL